MIPAKNPYEDSAEQQAEKRRYERQLYEQHFAEQIEYRERWCAVWESMTEEERATIREAAIGEHPILRSQFNRRGDTEFLKRCYYGELERLSAAVPF